ncbi:Uncharacterized protein OBRU01_26193 [Operophtera brumata]|uniref:Uncharacterized protein n=1 Tax=Operophtera brumata TaxID=104452 RepID=A0A0L7K3C1_OPEBR|nr:Uncharacterized protein OBRU01_26193 [Operophtera brumata]
MKIVTLFVGVALLGVASAEADQSELAIPEAMLEPGNVGKRQVETPEVVLQLKYDNGELNKIYLAQFRKPGKAWSPSVATRSALCVDLCHAGACSVIVCPCFEISSKM